MSICVLIYVAICAYLCADPYMLLIVVAMQCLCACSSNVCAVIVVMAVALECCTVCSINCLYCQLYTTVVFCDIYLCTCFSIFCACIRMYAVE